MKKENSRSVSVTLTILRSRDQAKPHTAFKSRQLLRNLLKNNLPLKTASDLSVFGHSSIWFKEGVQVLCWKGKPFPPYEKRLWRSNGRRQYLYGFVMLATDISFQNSLTLKKNNKNKISGPIAAFYSTCSSRVLIFNKFYFTTYLACRYIYRLYI